MCLLRLQYQLGMETLNETLTDLRCELVFRNETITFRPSVEVLRERYYQKMKDFIAYPTTFRPRPRPVKGGETPT